MTSLAPTHPYIYVDCPPLLSVLTDAEFRKGEDQILIFCQSVSRIMFLSMKLAFFTVEDRLSIRS